MKKILLYISIATLILFLNSCKKFNEGETNDEELITTLKLNFTPVGSSNTQTFVFEDIDGAGGNPPSIDTISLRVGTTYNVSIELWNNAAIPREAITPEVEDENTAHRLYYTPSAGSNITVSNLNNDVNGIALGTTSTWVAGAASSGNINITLRHYPGTPPDKQASDPVNSPKSSTDMTATFNYVIN